MTTALDILIRAKDDATRTVKTVGTTISETGTRAEQSGAKMTRFGEAGAKAGERVKTAIKGFAAAAGFVAIDELATKSLEAFDQLEVGEKRLGFGLQKIGESKKNLEGLVGWAKSFSNQTGIAESDIVGMQSKLTVMGGTFLKSLGPKADGTIQKITSGMVNLGSVTGKSASLLLRSLGPALLNSPKTAISQLQKYGVLSDAQVVKLTALTKAGKNHAASMMEINALYGKFKGAAQASETPMDKLKNGINQLELTIGSLINKGLGWLISTGWPALKSAFETVMAKAKPFIALLASAASGILPALKQAWAKIVPDLKQFWKASEPIAKVLAIIVGLVVVGLLKSLPILIRVTANVISIYIKLQTLLSTVVVGAFRLVIGAITGVIGAGKKVVSWVSSGFSHMVSFISGLPKRIASAASGMFDGIKNAFRSALNWIIRGWNSLQFTLPSVNTHIPGVGKIGGWTLGTPDIPYLANGGIATRATLAVIGEAGPEAVIPLNRARSMFGDGGINVALNVHGNLDNVTLDDVERTLDNWSRSLIRQMRAS
jgi:phage-related protein